MIIRVALGFFNVNIWNISSLIFILLVMCYSLHPARFASHYHSIQVADMNLEFEHAYAPIINACLTQTSIFHEKNRHLLYPNEEANEEPYTFARRYNILPGGQWQPHHCQPVFNVAVILPYRNRIQQLKVFMNYMHQFLQRQNIEYRIFVVEQSADKPFNRDNIYACTRNPRHMSSSVNTFRYNLPYIGLFGGAIAITRYQFQAVNGFSNTFFGWGAEDDDFYNRLQKKGLSVIRFSPEISRYYMLKHNKEVPSNTRFINLNSGSEKFDTDGISNLHYNVLKHQLQPLYSWILVKI